MGLFIRTIGIARAEATITQANMVYNMKRWCWLDGRIAPERPITCESASHGIMRASK